MILQQLISREFIRQHGEANWDYLKIKQQHNQQMYKKFPRTFNNKKILHKSEKLTINHDQKCSSKQENPILSLISHRTAGKSTLEKLQKQQPKPETNFQPGSTSTSKKRSFLSVTQYRVFGSPAKYQSRDSPPSSPFRSRQSIDSISRHGCKQIIRRSLSNKRLDFPKYCISPLRISFNKELSLRQSSPKKSAKREYELNFLRTSYRQRKKPQSNLFIPYSKQGKKQTFLAKADKILKVKNKKKCKIAPEVKHSQVFSGWEKDDEDEFYKQNTNDSFDDFFLNNVQ